MTRIKVMPHTQFCPQGAEFEADKEKNLCQQLLDNGVKIEQLAICRQRVQPAM